MTATLEPSPVVLIVEDEEHALQLRSEAFSYADCRVIGVRSLGDAMRELRREPEVDLVLTDIHLDKAPGDKSGVELARYVRNTYALPVAGYSAVFADDELTDDLNLFAAFWVKGSMDYRAIDEMVRSCRQLAVGRKEQRIRTGVEVGCPPNPLLSGSETSGAHAALSEGVRDEPQMARELQSQLYAALILAVQRPDGLAIDQLGADVSKLDSRVSDLSSALGRVEEQSVSRDRVAWTVLSVFACVAGLLGAIIALILGVQQLVGG